MGFMNERIKELADKIWAEEYWDNPATDKLLPAQLNKFAELIVRECGEVAYKTYSNNPLEVRGVHFKEAMYKRFGIRYE
jgi:hypothetical protein